MNTVLILTFVALFLTAAGGIAAAFYLLGINAMQRKMVVEGKRREKRLIKDVDVWQTFIVRKFGHGELKRKDKPPDEPKPATTRIVSASQAIAAPPIKQPVILAGVPPPKLSPEKQAEFLKGF